MDQDRRRPPSPGLLESLCRMPDSAIAARAGAYDQHMQRWIETPDNVPPPKGMEKPPKDFDEVVRAFPVTASAH